MQLPLGKVGTKSLALFCGFSNSKATLGGPLSAVRSALSWDANDNVPKMPGCPSHHRHPVMLYFRRHSPTYLVL